MTTHPDRERWDSRHRRWVDRGERPDPHEWLNDELHQWGGGPILDLASGISAIPTQITDSTPAYVAVDVSPVALRETRRLAEELNLTTCPIRADLERSMPVIPLRALYVVTFFYCRELFDTIAKSAHPGSRVVVETYVIDNGDAPISKQYCLEPGELPSVFSSWSILHYEENTPDHPETARLVAENKTGKIPD